MSIKGLQVTTPTNTTLIMTRTFQAPRRLVWEAMTDPAKMRRWMLPPPGFTMTTCEIEPRVGGALRIAWKSAEADLAMILQGVWTEFAPHERMVHTEKIKIVAGDVLISSLIETHEFAEQDGVTTMRITQTFESQADRDAGLAGAGEGMEACYAQLDLLFTQPA
jgi:uncharacterized protein YndB with AHSA1/START domain